MGLGNASVETVIRKLKFKPMMLVTSIFKLNIWWYMKLWKKAFGISILKAETLHKREPFNNIVDLWDQDRGEL
jgi:hypothetical protein